MKAVFLQHLLLHFQSLWSICLKFLISLILGSHFLQSEHRMQQTLYSVLISKSSFTWNSFSHFLSVFIVAVFWFEAIALFTLAVYLDLKKNTPSEWKYVHEKKRKYFLKKNHHMKKQKNLHGNVVVVFCTRIMRKLVFLVIRLIYLDIFRIIHQVTKNQLYLNQGISFN